MARLTLVALTTVIILIPSLSYAADLLVTPTAFSIGVGETATIAVRVASPSAAVNAISGKLNLSSETEVVSVMKDDSIVNFWVEEPKVTGAGIAFEGVVLNPGYQGTGGTLFKVLIRGKREGVARASFATGAIYANDGEGTNVLVNLTPAIITIGSGTSLSEPAEVFQAPTPTRAGAVPSPLRAPVTIRSTSHPDETVWYSARVGAFTWEPPRGADATRTSLSARKDAVPSTVYEGGITELSLSDLPEGVSYLAVQHRVGSVWGSVARYRVQVDSTPPTITHFEEFPRERRESGRVRFKVTADDTVSGVERYTVKTRDMSAQEWRDDGSGVIELLLPPGAHQVTLSVADRAGNVREEVRDVSVLPLKKPRAIDVPRSVELGVDTGAVTGMTEPGKTIEVLFYPVTIDVDPQSAASIVHAAASALMFEPKVAGSADAVAKVVTVVDAEGTFRAEIPKDLPVGRYDVWVISKDGTDGQSTPAGPYRLVVVKPGYMALGSIAVSLATLVLPLLIAVLALLTLSGLITWRHVGWRRTVLREAREVEDALDKSFKLLKDGVLREFDELADEVHAPAQKKAVERLRGTLTDNLRDARAYLRKEVEDLLRRAR